MIIITCQKPYFKKLVAVPAKFASGNFFPLIF
nr:MAG TPA: hypothetical protein [Caudoviricetes sp.]